MGKQYFQIGGINTYTNPLSADGQLIHAVNVDTFPLGAKRKRPGYETYLGTVSGQVNSMWQYAVNEGTFYNYAAAGSRIYYSLDGTGDWTVAGNGTISNNAQVGHAVLGTAMILGDGVGSTRHTGNGTVFTNTTLAPVATRFVEYQRRIYAAGTASTLFYSTANNPADWATSGTSDSSSFEVPGAGRLLTTFKAFDKLWTAKTSGLMHKWDGFSLIDLATEYGAASPNVPSAEGFPFLINQYGHYGFSGGQPQLFSNAIQRQFYNPSNTGIAGTAFATMPAECHRYDYLASVGTITDDFTDRTIPDAIIKYDFQKNEYLNWSFADKPTAFLSAKDANGDFQLYFGDASGNTYKLNPTVASDNGDAINAELVFVYTYDRPEHEKSWRYWRGIFNPGCQLSVQYAASNVFTYENLKWQPMGDVTNGVIEKRLDTAQGRFLFVRLYEYSKDPQWTFYGCEIDADVEEKR